jgi:hypothetical protein
VRRHYHLLASYTCCTGSRWHLLPLITWANVLHCDDTDGLQELAQQQVTALVSQATQQQGALAAALESERAQAAARLADFEAEIARLSQGVSGWAPCLCHKGWVVEHLNVRHKR